MTLEYSDSHHKWQSPSPGQLKLDLRPTYAAVRTKSKQSDIL